MSDSLAVESKSETGTRRRVQQRRLVCLGVLIIGVVGALHIQRHSLSLQSAPMFAAGLLGLLAAGEITVRILDRRSHGEGQVDDPVAEERVGALLEHLAGGGVVLHHVCAGHEPIDHLVFRPDGVVFLIETQPQPGLVMAEAGEVKLNGHPLPQQLFKQARRKLEWLRDFLCEQLGCDVHLQAGLVFSNAEVAAGYQSQEGVALLGLEHLEPWLDTAEPNDEFSKRLWPQMERLKTRLLTASESPSPVALTIPLGVVLLLGILWLAISAPSAAKQPSEPVPVPAPAAQAVLPPLEVAPPVAASSQPTMIAPGLIKAIHLEGLSGAPPHRLAIINRKTLAVGESATLKVGGQDVNIHCVDIQSESAFISVEGMTGTTELRLREEP